MIDESTDEILSPESISKILRDAVPMLVQTKAISESAYNDIQRIAIAVGALQTAMIGFERVITDIELRMTELESRLEVVSSRVREGEKKYE